VLEAPQQERTEPPFVTRNISEVLSGNELLEKALNKVFRFLGRASIPPQKRV
jgi:hypothetical protein